MLAVARVLRGRVLSPVLARVQSAASAAAASSTESASAASSAFAHVRTVRDGQVHVVLLSDVDRLGVRGDVVAVRPGFARNALCFGRNKSAVYATKENIAAYAQRDRTGSLAADEATVSMGRVRARLLRARVQVYRNPERAFVVTKDIVLEKLEKQFGVALQPEWVEFSDVAALGACEATVTLPRQQPVQLLIDVVRR